MTYNSYYQFELKRFVLILILITNQNFKRNKYNLKEKKQNYFRLINFYKNSVSLILKGSAPDSFTLILFCF